MTKAEIEKRIDELETQRFYLAMKDRWNADDYRTDNKWFNELLDLKKKLFEIA